MPSPAGFTRSPTGPLEPVQGTTHIALGVAFAACFCLAALLAVAEVSMVRVRRAQITVEAPPGPRRAQLLAILDDLPVALNAVLLLALLCQVGAATIAGYWSQRTFGDVAVSVSSVVLTLLLFVYAEAVPKTIAVSSPARAALRLSPFVAGLTRVLGRPVQFIVRFADLQSPSAASFSTVLSEPELRASAEEAAEAGEIDDDDVDRIERSFAFGDAAVSAIMVPVDRIISVPASCTVADALTTAIDVGHRRLPVVGASIDDVIGHVRLRDLAAMSRSRPQDTVAAIAAPIIRCRPHQLIATLLERMQSTGTWLALVEGVDSRTAGLVTIEDIVEELVGEIADDVPPST